MKKFWIRLLLIAAGILPAAIPTTALALDLSRTDSDAAQSFLNQGSLNVFSRYQMGTQLLTNQKRSVRCTYDFTVLGGSVPAGAPTTALLKSSTIHSASASLVPCILPKGAIITSALVDMITAVTGGGTATVALSTGQGVGDLKTATAIATFSTGILALTPVGTAATAIKLTADANPSITFAGAALTAGKFYVLIEYLLSQTL